MRTRFEIVIAVAGMSEADRRAAGEAALDEVNRAEDLLSAYRPDADLYQINARAADAPVRCDARTWAFLAEALRLSHATGGAFDPTVGPLLDLWRISGGDDGDGVTPPAEPEISDALTLVGMARNVVLNADTRTVAFVRAGVRLDPGAIGKGWAINRARDVLEDDCGVRSALLHGGTSTVCAVGAPPNGEAAWTVGVAHPGDPNVLLAHARLAPGLSLSVSAPHGKTVRDRATGAQYGHIVDPRTGYPVAAQTLLAAVVAPSATVTDAVSTALLVLGEPGLDDLARAFPDAAGFLLAVADPQTATGIRVVSRGDMWRFT